MWVEKVNSLFKPGIVGKLESAFLLIDLYYYKSVIKIIENSMNKK